MTSRISTHDWETLSAFLDNQLSQEARARVESRLKTDPTFRQEFEMLAATRTFLQSQPRLRSPRNFSLKPEMVAKPQFYPPQRQAYPLLRLTSVLATISFFVFFLGEVLVRSALPGAEPSRIEVLSRISQPVPQAFEMEAEGGFEATAPLPTVLAESPALASDAQPYPEVVTLSQTTMPVAKAIPVTPFDLTGIQTPAEQEAVEEASLKSPTQQKSLNNWDWLRIIQLALLVLAISAGIGAYYFRRRQTHQ